MSISLLVFLSILLRSTVDSAQSFSVRRDSTFNSNRIKYSLYDLDGKTLKLQIKSRLVRNKIRELFVYPEKKSIGKLTTKRSSSFDGDFSILDQKSNRWIDGNLTQINKVQFKGSILYSIDWNNRSLSMESSFFGLNVKIIREKTKTESLADFSRRSLEKSNSNEFVLNLYSDRYPLAFYFLLFTVDDVSREL